MDLYVQIGVFLTMAAMFSLLAYYYSVSMLTGQSAGEKLYKPSVNYSLDTAVTTPTFLVDARTFVQWATNARGQRQLYLVYPTSIEPDDDYYKEYLRELDITIPQGDISGRTLEVLPKSRYEFTGTNAFNPNAFEVSEQSAKVVDYLSVYAEEAKARGSNDMVTVYTFSDSSTQEVIYVCYIK